MADTQPFEPISIEGGGAWLLRAAILTTTGMLMLVILLAAALIAFQVGTRGRILPNITSLGVPLAGLSPSQAVEALQQRFDFPQTAVFTLRDPNSDDAAGNARFWQLTPEALGFTFDAEATAATAYSIGRGRGLVQDMADSGLTWLNGYDAAPLVRYDQNAARAELTAIAREIDRPAQDAQLVVSGLDVQTTPASTGRTLDVEATLALLDARILAMDAGEITLIINERPPLTPDPTEAAARVRAALSSPITLTATDASGASLGPWTISRESIGGLINIDIARSIDGTLGYNVAADIAPLRAYLEALAPGLITPSRDGRYDFDANTGQLIVLQPSTGQRTLNIDATVTAVQAALFNPVNRTIPLVFDETPAEFNDGMLAADIGITERVAQGVSSFAGSSQARITNIQQAASRFDGLIIRPGDTFSFNYYVGDISPEAGFEDGFVIIGGRTVRGVGGGVCQVSTTAFRAAFYAGYPIVERYAHGYRVGYYEDSIEGPGMDAAIFTPDLDFKFINNTPYHLLITTDVDLETQRVMFNFYSTNPGIRVAKGETTIRDVVPALPTVYEPNPELAPGQSRQTDWGAEGAYVAVTRVITDLNGNPISSEIVASQYQPWASVVQVGS